MAREINYNMKLFTALAMVLVVTHHITQGHVGWDGPFAMFKAYSFHVAAFIFVSGYFYNSAHESHPLRYIGRQARKFVIPLFLISMAYGLLCEALNQVFGFSLGKGLSAWSLLIAPFTVGHQFYFNIAMWFIAPLFIAECVNVLLRRALPISTRETLFESVLFVLYLALGAIAIIISGPEGLQDRDSSGALTLACKSLFFIACLGMGRFYHSVLEKRDTCSNTKYFVVLLAVQLVIIVFCRGDYTYIPSWCKFPKGVLLTYAVTITGIAFLLRICKLAGPVIGKSRVVLAIADCSFSIMCHQFLAFFLVTTAFALLSATTPLCHTFDMTAYLQGSRFFYPFQLNQFALLYAAAGLCIPVIMHRLWAQSCTVAAQLIRQATKRHSKQ